MNNGFEDVGISFSICCLFLLLCRHFFLTFYGPKVSYLSWLLIPASIIIPFISIPNWFAELTEGQSITQFITVINTSNNSLSNSSEQFLLIIWLVGFTALLSCWLYRHVCMLLTQSEWSTTLLNNPNVDTDKLAVFKSSHVHSPMLVGLLQPKLLLPEDFETLFSEEQQTLILEHELCHFKRNDMVWNSMALFLLALFWFHPLAWLAFFRFRRDQELSCDQTVLARKHITNRINYGKALLLAAETSPSLSFAQLSFKEYGDKNVMFERINLIKNNPKSSKLLTLVMIASAAIILSALSFAGENKDIKNISKEDNIQPIVRIEPKYPIKAAQENIEGSVVLKYDVLPNGTVANISIYKANPEKIFDKVAVTALKKWKFNVSKTGLENVLVQLDFAMNEHSTFKFQNLTERIKVIK